MHRVSACTSILVCIEGDNEPRCVILNHIAYIDRGVFIYDHLSRERDKHRERERERERDRERERERE